MDRAETDPLFDAVLYPHRSLSPRGVRMVIAGVGGLVALVALYFTALGAWPVLPFFGCEILLIIWAFLGYLILFGSRRSWAATLFGGAAVVLAGDADTAADAVPEEGRAAAAAQAQLSWRTEGRFSPDGVARSRPRGLGLRG